ncbi:extracellular solute-binding protein [Paenibacillus thermoaerophilus]|uniref:Extracellular solute-binding protein n=1 Tax=Paenibacillus thermoaerophilus TaxID=1215385 RepID=A0ABW2V130_9BACL|nr:extracellular solute-binding protein [Paenibacillus thermoaerophilus]TMV17450.1 extracellular solute-binding protein [Paenibacillus thermoaerophilus]
MKWKRYTTVMLAASMSIGTVACSGSDNDKGSSAQPSASAGANASPSEAPKKYKITALDYRYGNPPPSSSQGLTMINERFNVDYQVTFVTNTAYDEKINAVFASGEIPDMVGFMAADLKNRYSKFAKQNAFLPLDDYIKQYPTLQAVPDFIWDALRVNGKIYAIPQYAPKYQVVLMVRKDWLDKLNLKPPTNYQELKEVAIAFTKNDPDGNGKNDTYGIAIGQDINPNLNMGPYWDPDAWYHKNDKGDLIPGIIGPGRKEIVQMLADLNKEGAITKDYATLNWADTNKEFYSGKAGIFIATPRGMSQDYMNGLLKIHPNAQFIHLEPFVDAYGNKGLTSAAGFNGLTVLSAKLANEPDKVKRILDMIDFGRKFYKESEKNDKNPDFDWWSGKVGVAYDMKDGVAVNRENWANDGLAPSTYFVDNAAWPPEDGDIDYSLTYQTKPLSDLVKAIQNMYKTTKLYANPVNSAESKTDIEKGAELRKYVMNEQVKMIAGNRPVSDWDKLVQEYLDKGGAKIIEEYNAQFKNKDTKALFK